MRRPHLNRAAQPLCTGFDVTGFGGGVASSDRTGPAHRYVSIPTKTKEMSFSGRDHMMLLHDEPVSCLSSNREGADVRVSPTAAEGSVSCLYVEKNRGVNVLQSTCVRMMYDGDSARNRPEHDG